jgi:hypothetical protein
MTTTSTIINNHHERRPPIPWIAIVATAIASQLAGCATRTVVDVTATATAERAFPPRVSIDMLFVLTVGGSTAALKRNVGKSFPMLHKALLAGTAGSPLSLHIGTTSSEMGAGPFQPPSCDPRMGRLYLPTKELYPSYPRPSDPFIVVENGSSNLSGHFTNDKLYEAFSTLIDVDGCSPSGSVAHLEASRMALLRETNPGFLRDDSTLFVLYVVDTMDCSLDRPELFDPATQKAGIDSTLGPWSSFRCFEFGFRCDINNRTAPGVRKNCEPIAEWLFPIERYLQFYRNLRQPGELILASIAGPPEPVEVMIDHTGTPMLKTSETCYEGGAQPELRLHRLMKAFPPTLSSPKCTGPGHDADYDKFFAEIGAAIAMRRREYCLPLPPLAIAAPSTSDIAARCHVLASTPEGSIEVPACDAPSETSGCWSPAVIPACTESWGIGVAVSNQLASSPLVIRCVWPQPNPA